MTQNEFEGLLMMRPESRIAINNALAETLEAMSESENNFSITSNNSEGNYLDFTFKKSKNPREEKTRNYRKRNECWHDFNIWDWYTKEPGIINEQAICKAAEVELDELGFHTHVKPSYGKVQKDAIRKYGK